MLAVDAGGVGHTRFFAQGIPSVPPFKNAHIN